jgi:hypothetical protein
MKKTMITAFALVAATVLAGAAHAEGPQKKPGHGKFLEQLDTNGDGNISKEEFEAGRKARADGFFAKLDKNGDGVISKDEFAAGNGGAEAFERFDRNKDGVINKADRPEHPDRAEGGRPKGEAPPPPGGDVPPPPPPPAK